MFALASAVLGTYLWRTHGTTRRLRAELEQRVVLQKRLMENIPSDNCLYPHFKNAVGYAFNPFMKRGTMWGLKGHSYEINSWGLRGGEIEEKRPGRKRIVLLGDSWFFGWSLKDEDRLESHLRAALKDGAYEVVTVALPGWNVRSEAEFLKSHIRGLNPDVVIWEICPNDSWQVGAVIPPGTLSMSISPQNRELESNALTMIKNPLPLMPFVVDRYLENLALMDEVRTGYGLPVLAAPVDIPAAEWAFLAAKSGSRLPVRFIPRTYAADRRGWIGEHDSHPTAWMNQNMAAGYVSKLAEMGVVPAPSLDAAQAAIVREWERVNSSPVSDQEIDRHIRSVMDQVPEVYAKESDFGQVAAGVAEDGRMGRRGVLYLRTRGARSGIVLELDVGRHAPRYRREVKVSARTFEREVATATREFSGAEQRVTCHVPLPTAASQYSLYEVEWAFNYDECEDPTRCASARLVRAYSR